MNKTAILILAGAAAFTTACTFGPMWTKPEMPVPAEFRGNGIGGSSMAELPWQSVIRDSNLQNLLNDVFENNRSLESLSHNVDAARQYVTIARAPMFPWLGYSASTSKGMNQSGGAGVAQMGGVTTNPASMSVSASWKLTSGARPARVWKAPRHLPRKLRNSSMLCVPPCCARSPQATCNC